MPESTATHIVQEYIEPEGPDEIPGVRNYTRVKFQTRQYYIPIMKGSKYAMYVNQLEYYGEIHLDAHILSMKIQEEKSDVITAIMAQLLLKVRLK